MRQAAKHDLHTTEGLAQVQHAGRVAFIGQETEPPAQILHPRGHGPFVRHGGEGFSVQRLPQHHLREGGPFRIAEHPGNAGNQRLRHFLPHAEFRLQLGFSVHVHGAALVRLRFQAGPPAVQHVVRAQVDEAHALQAADASHHLRGHGVHAVRRLRIIQAGLQAAHGGAVHHVGGAGGKQHVFQGF